MSEMTRVAERSSGSGSSVVNNQPPVFDISNEAGLLALLRTLHRSGTKQAVKNELRDILFSVKNDDTDAQLSAVKALEEAGFKATFGGKSLHTDVSGDSGMNQSKPRNGFGRARNVPRFASVAATSNSSAPDISKNAEPQPEHVEVKVTEATQPPVVETQSSVPSPQEVAPNNQENVQTETAPETTEKSAEVSSVESPTAPVDVGEAKTTPSPAQFEGNPMDRIKEIKRLVNEKVGNPITLIDTDNKVGREYMNALLAAMKVSNGGRPEEITAAMGRLEEAYKEAIRVVETMPAPETTTDKFVNSTKPPVPDVPPVQPSSVSTPAQAPAVSQTPEPSPVAVSEPEPASIPEVQKMTAVGSSEAPNTVEPEVAAASFTPVPPRAPQQPVVESSPAVEVSSPLSSAALSAETPAEESVPEGGVDSTRLMSVAKEEQLENLMRQNKLQEAQAQQNQSEQSQASSDPLMLPEVTAGLKQLLSEWSLFKGSGFFGTGPAGMDHSLYKQMSTLTMAAVIAGRFEGATPQVKQSITDYMNGWRYEEGIVHEHTETFEHYLRRVIKHILDKKGS